MLTRASRLVQARASAPAVRLGAVRMASTFMTNYKKEVAERAAMGIVPKPLDAAKTAALVELLQKPPADEGKELLEMLKRRVPPGVDEAAYVKAGFLAAVAKGDAKSPLISQKDAVFLLGTMQGGYNIQPLVDALDKPDLAEIAAEVAERFDVIAVAVAHRTGALEIGDCALAAAVSAAHRGDAFAACSALVEETKARIPVWKHQFFADGTDEWVNCA